MSFIRVRDSRFSIEQTKLSVEQAELRDELYGNEAIAYLPGSSLSNNAGKILERSS